jgi:Mn-dependent DtxR family transcriptional regulator
MLAKSFKVFKPSEEMRDLRILEELEKNPFISQRQLSHKFKIALGLTNACLNKMAREGWIRMEGKNHRTIGYYLTPRGMAEEARLTHKMITCTLEQYSELKKIISERLLQMKREGMRRVVFYGVGDEMEVSYVTLQGLNLNLVGIVEDDEKCRPQIIFGYELEPVSRISELKPDGVLITSLSEIDLKKQKIKALMDSKKVSIKDICVS